MDETEEYYAAVKRVFAFLAPFILRFYLFLHCSKSYTA